MKFCRKVTLLPKPHVDAMVSTLQSVVSSGARFMQAAFEDPSCGCGAGGVLEVPHEASAAHPGLVSKALDRERLVQAYQCPFHDLGDGGVGRWPGEGAFNVLCLPAFPVWGHDETAGHPGGDR